MPPSTTGRGRVLAPLGRPASGRSLMTGCTAGAPAAATATWETAPLARQRPEGPIACWAGRWRRSWRSPTSGARWTGPIASSPTEDPTSPGCGSHPSTFRRVLTAHGLGLPQQAPQPRRARTPWPHWLVWEPNRIWIYDVTHFSVARRAVFAIVDMVSRRWIATLASTEETSTQVRGVRHGPYRGGTRRAAHRRAPRPRRRRPRPADPARGVRQRAGHDLHRHPRLHDAHGHRPAPRPAAHPHRPGGGSSRSSGTSNTSGPTSARSPTQSSSTPSWPASATNTTPCASTKRSATLPPTTNTTIEANPSARPAGKACDEPANNGSTTTAGPQQPHPTTPRN